jgi:hypothetical protein
MATALTASEKASIKLKLEHKFQKIKLLMEEWTGKELSDQQLLTVVEKLEADVIQNNKTFASKVKNILALHAAKHITSDEALSKMKLLLRARNFYAKDEQIPQAVERFSRTDIGSFKLLEFVREMVAFRQRTAQKSPAPAPPKQVFAKPSPIKVKSLDNNMLPAPKTINGTIQASKVMSSKKYINYTVLGSDKQTYYLQEPILSSTDISAFNVGNTIQLEIIGNKPKYLKTTAKVKAAAQSHKVRFGLVFEERDHRLSRVVAAMKKIKFGTSKK